MSKAPDTTAKQLIEHAQTLRKDTSILWAIYTIETAQDLLEDGETVSAEQWEEILAIFNDDADYFFNGFFEAFADAVRSVIPESEED
ncbi:hypothetical protein UFOVP45_121 [uncultured Caudovirales phage]|uniref:Uncharacterized protein n=1 Tax=uncultured Caudovirales phage TaxID=2100421 RepID=A0A6J5KV10_9CAUD|nr:hypothetical protein UFOVP45_121 [uncultured Caudovirales phage]